jgi:DNA-binding HxlR family transcriptional regulator
MPRRKYDQACSVAAALDRIGERWAMLIVRELSLGPLRFSELARGVGGAPTDILTRRLRDLEADGIVRRIELDLPASGVAYELTELGDELDGAMLELGRWGLNFYSAESVADITPIWLANALRVVLQPPPEAALAVQLHSEGISSWLRIEGGSSSAGRGELSAPDLTISGPPPAIVAGLVVGNSAGVPGVEIEGDAKLLDRLRGWVVIPDRLREEAQMMVESGALLIAATEAAAAAG